MIFNHLQELAIVLFIGSLSIMTNSDNNKSTETIMGTSFLAIRDASNTLRHRKLDLSRYNIEVFHKEEPDVVIFARKEEQFGVRPQANGELSAAELKSYLSKRDNTKVADKIHGENYLAIQAAMEPFQP